MDKKEFHIGFTGTQLGMTSRQKEQVKKNLDIFQIDHKFNDVYCHHGDCIGADKEFHDMVLDCLFDVVVHPPNIKDKRAFCDDYRFMFPEKSYLERNHDIVDNSDVLIATPKQIVEQIRSGTWATIRYARKLNKPIMIIEP